MMTLREPASPHTPAQVPGVGGPGAPDPYRDLDPLERLGVLRDRRRRRMGAVIFVLLVPGLAFPLLSRRAPAKAKPICQEPLEAR